MSEEGIELPAKVSAELKAELTANISEESMDKVVDATVDAARDLLYPIREITGLIGDKIKTFRNEQAIKNYIAIGDYAAQFGLIIDIPPPKFLIPFTEQLSLEEMTEPTLQAMWANLLINSSNFQSENGLVYIDILKKLTCEQANLLLNIHHKTELLYAGPYVLSKDNPSDDYLFYRAADKALAAETGEERTEILQELLEKLMNYDVLEILNAGFNIPSELGFLRGVSQVGEHQRDARILSNLGLVEVKHTEFSKALSSTSLRFNFSHAEPSALGESFIYACIRDVDKPDF